MKLFTHNVLTSKALKDVKEGFPLGIEATKVEMTEVEFDKNRTLKMLLKVEWPVAVAAAKKIDAEAFCKLPDTVPENVENDDEFLQLAHKVLMEIEIVEGHLICPETQRKFPISDGIVNMLINEDEHA